MKTKQNQSAGTLAIFGISGRTGRVLAHLADSTGWRVCGLVRAESQAGRSLNRYEIVIGEFSDTAKVAETLEYCDAACCVIGPHPPYDDAFCASATAAVIEAMKYRDCRRLICQTGAMIGSAPGRSWIMERMTRTFTRRQPVSAQDRIRQEELVIGSGLDWTLVKPPRLTDGPARGKIRAGADIRIGLLSKISRQDLAAFILQELRQNRFVHQRVFVKG